MCGGEGGGPTVSCGFHMHTIFGIEDRGYLRSRGDGLGATHEVETLLFSG